MTNIDLNELAKAGGATRGVTESRRKPTRAPITLMQQPLAVRQQLMMIKAKTGKTIENLMAEAINDLFAKYGEPEIAVIKDKG